MFELRNACEHQLDLNQPWELTLEKRLFRLVAGSQNGKKCVVYLYEIGDRSTFRYRGYNMCQVLSQSLEWTGTYFFADELERIYKYISLMDIVVIIRFRWNHALAKMINELKRRRKRVLFDVDDLVYNVRYLPLILNTLAEDLSDPKIYDHWFAYISRIFLSAESCDAYISTNEFIATHLRQDFGRPCHIMPNFMNQEQETISALLWEQKQKITSRKPFWLGYFSGSPSHQHDFATVAEEIKELLYEFEDLQIKIVGFMELSSDLMQLQKQGKIMMVPLRAFQELQLEIAEVDINIVPLLDNAFTNCKSELKFFEAGIVGTLTCAAPTYIYRQIVQPGHNGYLCRPGEWYPIIRDLYLSGIDQRLIDNAHFLSKEQYGWRNQLQRLEKMLNAL